MKYNLTQVANRGDTPSLSTIRRDIATGRISVEKNSKGRILFDVSELIRVYEIKFGEVSNDSSKTQAGKRSDILQDTSSNDKIISLLEGQVKDLKERENRLCEEKSELMELVKNQNLLITNQKAKTDKSNSYVLPILLLGLAAWAFVFYRVAQSTAFFG